MHQPNSTIHGELRQDLARRLDAESLGSACREAGHFWRKCLLDPVAIVHRFVIRILQGNTSLEAVCRSPSFNSVAAKIDQVADPRHAESGTLGRSSHLA